MKIAAEVNPSTSESTITHKLQLSELIILSNKEFAFSIFVKLEGCCKASRFGTFKK